MMHSAHTKSVLLRKPKFSTKKKLDTPLPAVSIGKLGHTFPRTRAIANAGYSEWIDCTLNIELICMSSRAAHTFACTPWKWWHMANASEFICLARCLCRTELCFDAAAEFDGLTNVERRSSVSIEPFQCTNFDGFPRNLYLKLLPRLVFEDLLESLACKCNMLCNSVAYPCDLQLKPHV